MGFRSYEFGTHLKHHRTVIMEMSQQEYSRAWGINRSHLSELEVGKRIPSPRLLKMHKSQFGEMASNWVKKDLVTKERRPKLVFRNKNKPINNNLLPTGSVNISININQENLPAILKLVQSTGGSYDTGNIAI